MFLTLDLKRADGWQTRASEIDINILFPNELEFVIGNFPGMRPRFSRC